MPWQTTGLWKYLEHTCVVNMQQKELVLPINLCELTLAINDDRNTSCHLTPRHDFHCEGRDWIAYLRLP